MLSAAVSEFDLSAHGGEQLASGLNVANVWDVFEDDRLVGEQGSGDAGKSRVFCSANADSAEERLTAADDELIHE